MLSEDFLRELKRFYNNTVLLHKDTYQDCKGIMGHDADVLFLEHMNNCLEKALNEKEIENDSRRRLQI
jgi:hypothetical protein